MKRAILLAAAVISLAAAANAQGVAIGATVENFSVADPNGKAFTLNELKGTNGAVIIFVSAHCPVVRAYNERMNILTKEYAAKGINVIGINSNVTEMPGEIKAHGDATYKFPVFIDKNSSLADKLGATKTPEVYYVNAKNVLLYHGAIDNNRGGDNVTEPHLKTAVDATLAGKKVEKASTVAFGCTIKKPGEGN